MRVCVRMCVWLLEIELVFPPWWKLLFASFFFLPHKYWWESYGTVCYQNEIQNEEDVFFLFLFIYCSRSDLFFRNGKHWRVVSQMIYNVRFYYIMYNFVLFLSFYLNAFPLAILKNDCRSSIVTWPNYFPLFM